MLPFIALIPGVLCAIAIVRGGTAYAFRVVYLPTLLLLPAYFTLMIQHLPEIGFDTSVLWVLLAGMCVYDLPRWKFTRSDLWLAIFMFSTAYADRLFGRVQDSWLHYIGAITAGVIPYMAGKLLIEQTGNRAAVCRTFVWLLTASAVFTAEEYVTRWNVYAHFWNHFFPTQWGTWPTQIRWGFGRVSGPFAQSELAGMMLFIGMMFALWVGRRNFEEKALRKPPLLKRGRWHILVLVVVLFTTQARGPWIGTLIALPIAAVGWSKRPGVRALIVFTLLLAVGIPFYARGKSYVSASHDSSQEQQTAEYREHLLDNYEPIAKQGGTWGWGTEFPRVDNQISIDNTYLWQWLVQGWVGMVSFALLLMEAVLALAIQAVRAKTVRDRHFVFTMLAIFLGAAFIIGTVEIADQTYDMMFLLIGWSQAIVPLAARRPVRVRQSAAVAVQERRGLQVYS